MSRLEKMVYLVLRDPPGGLSTASVSKGSTLSVGVTSEGTRALGESSGRSISADADALSFAVDLGFSWGFETTQEIASLDIKPSVSGEMDGKA